MASAHGSVGDTFKKGGVAGMKEIATVIEAVAVLVVAVGVGVLFIALGSAVSRVAESFLPRREG